MGIKGKDYRKNYGNPRVRGMATVTSLSPEELRRLLELKRQLKRPVADDDDEEDEGLLTGLDEMDSGDWEWWHDPDVDYNE